jgi:regulator of RNase E activity RraA/CMP-N-acetylneuraminic acid synthetase
MKVAAFLPVKGSSSRIESKNLKLLDGKPLFLHTLEKLLTCDFIDEVYLDTESEEVIQKASYLHHKVLKRDPALANNKTDGHRLFMNEVNQVEADIYIQILCTSPFIEIETIKKGIDEIRDSEFDCAVLVKNDKLYTWNDNGPNYDLLNIPNSVDLPNTIIETMGLYIVKKNAALSTQRRIGAKPYLLSATATEAVDVNWPEDFVLAELIAAGLREKDRVLLDNLKNQLNSSLLSDLLDDLGYSTIVNGLLPNIDGAKIFGRAKTLKIRKLEDGESYKGIYEALQSYHTIVPNDVILVENEISDYAYFGELNANLAIRSGATGAIVAGMTRDSADVIKLGFPVFAKGNKCIDVRGRATLGGINVPIDIEGVQVLPGDLVFADNEGIVFIPKEIESKLLKLAIEACMKEKSVLLDIANGMDVDLLVKRNGEF